MRKIAYYGRQFCWVLLRQLLIKCWERILTSFLPRNYLFEYKMRATSQNYKIVFFLSFISNVHKAAVISDSWWYVQGKESEYLIQGSPLGIYFDWFLSWTGFWCRFNVCYTMSSLILQKKGFDWWTNRNNQFALCDLIENRKKFSPPIASPLGSV